MGSWFCESTLEFLSFCVTRHFTWQSSWFTEKVTFFGTWGIWLSEQFLYWQKYYLTALFNNMRTPKSNLNRQMRFSLPSIKCSAAPPCFRLLPSERLLNQIVEHSSDNVVGSWKEPPNIWLTAAKKAFVGWAFNFKVCMLLESAVMFWSSSRDKFSTLL